MLCREAERFYTGIVVTDYLSFTIDGDTRMTVAHLQPESSQVELPRLHEFMPAILTYLSDGAVRTSQEIRTAVADQLSLSPEQMTVRLPSRRLVYADRTYWAYKCLEHWGALTSPKHAHFAITDKGQSLIAKYPSGLPVEVALQIRRDSLTRHKLPKETENTSTRLPTNGVSIELTDSTPEELITESVAQLESALAHDILERVRVLSPSAFEQLVVDVLLAMGYGGSEGRGMVTQASNDGGIDGVIDQDALGLSKIYVQAKRYGEKNSVGRPEVQSFVGAMHGRATQGVFITSGSFTSGARKYAQNLGGGLSLVLIDGEHLARLLIKYRVGVQVARIYTVMKLDEDFFAEP